MPKTHTQLTSKEKREILQRVVHKKESVGQVATLMGRSRGTINYLIKKWSDTGNIKRKTVLSRDDKKAIVKLVRRKPSVGLTRVKSKLNLDASINTIALYLTKRGFVTSGSKARPIREET